jgi:hypothetical protein
VSEEKTGTVLVDTTRLLAVLGVFLGLLGIALGVLALVL